MADYIAESFLLHDDTAVELNKYFEDRKSYEMWRDATEKRILEEFYNVAIICQRGNVV